jgi:parallel beta-helix repeat protein
MFISNSTNITISNCSLYENLNTGIRIKNTQILQSSYCVISRNGDEGFYISDESTGIQITHCLIDRNTGSGIDISESTEIQVRLTVISNNSQMGIWAYNPNIQMMRYVIDNCTVSANPIAGIHLESYKGHPSYSRITNCKIHHNGIGHGGYGLLLSGLSHNLIDNCTIHHNEDTGIVIASGNNVISNCSIYSHLSTPLLGTGISLEGRSPPFIGRGLYSGKDNIVKYCTIYDNMIGISLGFILRTVIHYCNITQNHDIGIFPVFAWCAQIYHNNIVGNGLPYPTVNGSGVMPWWSFLDMRENWWGAADGPIYRFHAGHGDTIVGWLSFVLFRPWLSEPVSDTGRQT